jgi:parvulin-like peptidyl-prolyl isomerase
VRALWNSAFPPGEKRDTLTSKARPRIEKEYERMSHIFFNTAQQPDFARDPDRVREEAKKKALEAWQRLQKGEDFAKVARERSEDSNSRPQGGSLGCVQKGTFGDDVEKAFEALKPDGYSQPVESPWGFHIVRRELLTESDVVGILRDEYESTKAKEIDESIQKSAKIERIPF